MAAEPDFRTISFPPGSKMIPEDLPMTKATPTTEPFDLDAYEAKEAARLEALPNACHIAEIVASLNKALLPEGFGKRPFADLRLSLFIDAMKKIEDEM